MRVDLGDLAWCSIFAEMSSVLRKYVCYYFTIIIIHTVHLLSGMAIFGYVANNNFDKICGRSSAVLQWVILVLLNGLFFEIHQQNLIYFNFTFPF